MVNHRAFTLIELIAVIVVLAVLAGVALPRFFDHSSSAKVSADSASIAGITTALQMAFLDHRLRNAPAGEWIDEVADIPALMETGKLPNGITIVGTKLADQRNHTYTFTAETADAPATLTDDGAAS